MTQNNRTAADFLAAWDKGEVVETVEMGGIGPGYEQCIQVAMIALLRAQGGAPLPLPADPDNPTPAECAALNVWGDAADATLRSLDLGMSGAQAGAAKVLAYRMLRDGWDATLDSMRAHDSDRIIMCSRHWPTLAAL